MAYGDLTDRMMPLWGGHRGSPGRLCALLDGALPQTAGRDGSSSVHGIRTEDLSDVHGLLARLEPDPGTDPHPMPQGGEQAGLERWKRFLSGGLDRYSDLSREPGVGGISGMSPYLRFGQVSALRMALDARTGGSTGAEAFFEQLVVRREQAFNLVRYREDYDRYLRRRLGAP